MMDTLHALLEGSAQRYPGTPAVRDPGRQTVITYADLDSSANELSAILFRHGVRAGDRVGLCLPKCVGSIISAFGAMKAGAAYVPVDYQSPPERNVFIFENCSVSAIVAERSAAEVLMEAASETGLVILDSLDFTRTYGVDLVLLSGFPSRGEPGVEGMSYILYTSGSTGQPKGVIHTHESALSFVNWCADLLTPSVDDIFSSHAPLHFDLSILDIYVPLGRGATLVIIGEDLGKQPKPLAEFISVQGITHWYSTPAILRLLVEYGELKDHDYSGLRVVNFAGEVFPMKHFHALKAYWPDAVYFNLYGPTETNVCTYYEVPGDVPDSRTEPFPIGVACSSDECRVVDDNDREVADGEEGELIVRGGSVMTGYWNDSHRSSAAFLRDDGPVGWYRTGDIVRTDANGDYIFVGRRDRMVKRRGYRVELAEIEAALYRHPSVSEAAVVSIPDEDNGVLIKAFIEWSGEEKPSLIRLKRFCTNHLPMYMLPDGFVFLPSLPKTSTDKMNYQKLAEHLA